MIQPYEKPKQKSTDAMFSDGVKGSLQYTNNFCILSRAALQASGLV